jgi:hypothetical protein
VKKFVVTFKSCHSDLLFVLESVGFGGIFSIEEIKLPLGNYLLTEKISNDILALENIEKAADYETDTENRRADENNKENSYS